MKNFKVKLNQMNYLPSKIKNEKREREPVDPIKKKKLKN